LLFNDPRPLLRLDWWWVVVINICGGCGFIWIMVNFV